MKFRYVLTDSIQEFIEGSTLEEINIGCSSSQVIRVMKNDQIYFLKIMENSDLFLEYQKLLWLEGKIPVSKVVLFEEEKGVFYLITEEVKGYMLCDSYYQSHVDQALKVIESAFKQFYIIDIKDCPFDFDLQSYLQNVRSKYLQGLILDEQLSSNVKKQFGTILHLLDYLEENQFYDEPVFSFGDLSLPNIIAVKDRLSGFVDVGSCMIFGKWFDIAICEKSIRRNLGEEAVLEFYQILNLKRDQKKIEYYWLLLEIMD